MSTGIILGLGLASIVIGFYIMLNFNMWIKAENSNMKKVIKFFYNPNMVICIPVWAMFGYGAYVVVLEFI